MTTSTSLTSSSFMPKVVKGCDAAMDAAHSNGTGIGVASVLDAKGQVALIAVYREGRGMEFMDASDDDVTDVMVSALRDFHGYKTFH